MATNWMGNFGYNGGQLPTPKQNLQNMQGISNKVRSGSTFRSGANGGWQEYDMWGNVVGQDPAPQVASSTTASNDDAAKIAANSAQEPPQKSYGGIVGGYGSGDPAEVVNPKEDTTGTGVTPDGGPAVNPAVKPLEPITIAAGSAATTLKNGRRGGAFGGNFGGMTLTEEMLKGVPETDLAKIRDAAAKGPGAFKEFMKMSASAPWYAQISKAIQDQIVSNRKTGEGPRNLVRQPGQSMGDYAPAWMQKRRAENEAKRNPPMQGWPIDPTNPYGDEWKRTGPPPDYGGMQFIDRNQDGIDDRTQMYGNGDPSKWIQPQPGMMYPGGNPNFNEGGGPGFYGPAPGGPQQNPPFDPRILQMLMGGQYNG